MSKYLILVLGLMALPSCVLEQEPMGESETVFSESAALSEDLEAEVGVESTGTWQATSIESCNEFPCFFVSDCPPSPAGTSCSPTGSSCKEPLSGQWVQLYQCM